MPDQGSIHPSVVGKILSSKEYDRVDWDDLVQLAAGKLAADAAKAGEWIKTHAPVEQIREIEALAETVIGDRPSNGSRNRMLLQTTRRLWIFLATRADTTA